MSSAEHERLLRRARMQDAALFRYRLIGPALEEGLTTKQRGRVVRGIAGQVHAGPGGRGVQVSRKTIDRWIRAWRTGGFEALLPSDRKCEPVTAQSVLAMAAALKRENMERTAAQVRRIMVAQAGDAPSERTLQRHFAREDLTNPRGAVVFGRFEAEAPNVLWVADVLHGPLIGGRKTYLVAFLDDHSRFITGHRWGWSEDSLHLAVAFKRAVAARGLPGAAYVDNGACFVDETIAVTCAKLGIRITHSPPYRPPLTGQSLDHLPVFPLHVNREPDWHSAACRTACRLDRGGSDSATGVPWLMLNRCGCTEAGNAGGSRACGGPLTGSCAMTTWAISPTGATRRPASGPTRSTCCTSPAGWQGRASAWMAWIPTRCCGTWPRAGPSAAKASTTT